MGKILVLYESQTGKPQRRKPPAALKVFSFFVLRPSFGLFRRRLPSPLPALPLAHPHALACSLCQQLGALLRRLPLAAAEAPSCGARRLFFFFLLSLAPASSCASRASSVPCCSSSCDAASPAARLPVAPAALCASTAPRLARLVWTRALACCCGGPRLAHPPSPLRCPGPSHRGRNRSRHPPPPLRQDARKRWQCSLPRAPRKSPAWRFACAMLTTSAPRCVAALASGRLSFFFFFFPLLSFFEQCRRRGARAWAQYLWTSLPLLVL